MTKYLFDLIDAKSSTLTTKVGQNQNQYWKAKQNDDNKDNDTMNNNQQYYNSNQNSFYRKKT